MSDQELLNKLNSIETMLKEQNMLKKDVLNFGETALYLELSHSHLYKLTSGCVIAHYKPNGKKIYFKREELDAWLLSNRTQSNSEIEQEASDFTINEGRE